MRTPPTNQGNMKPRPQGTQRPRTANQENRNRNKGQGRPAKPVSRPNQAKPSKPIKPSQPTQPERPERQVKPTKQERPVNPAKQERTVKPTNHVKQKPKPSKAIQDINMESHDDHKPSPQRTTSKLKSKNKAERRTKYTLDKLKSSDLRQVPTQTRETKKKNKLSKIIIRTVIVLLVIVLCGGGYFMWNKYNSIPSLDNIKPRIEELYISNEKSELKQEITEEDVAKILADIDGLQTKESDIAERDGLRNEVKTIQSYMSDRKVLSVMLQEGYDLDNADYSSKVTGVNTSLSGYKVQGLATRVREMLTEISDEKSSYENIKQALIGVASGTDVNPEEYIPDIDAKINHKTNKEKLTSVISNIQLKQETMKKLDACKDAKQKKTLEEDRVKLQEKIMAVLMPDAGA